MGDPKQIHTQSEKRERAATWQHSIGPPHSCGSHISDKWVLPMPRDNTLLGRLSMSMPRGTLPLVHLTHAAHTLAQNHMTGGSHLCHVAVNHWSMSAIINKLLVLRERCATLFRVLRTAVRWDAEEGYGDPSRAYIYLVSVELTARTHWNTHSGGFVNWGSFRFRWAQSPTINYLRLLISRHLWILKEEVNIIAKW
jgi:hypothetical protein